MTQTPATYLTSKINNAMPTKSSVDFGQNGHTSISKKLLSFPLCEKTLLSGSYKRNKANKPLNDVDILMIMKCGTRLTKQLRAEIREHVQKNLPDKATLQNQDKSIGIDLPGRQVGLDSDERVTFDVIPTIVVKDNQLQILSRGGETIDTWPALATEKVKERDEASAGYFRKLVRVLKTWNKHNSRWNPKFKKYKKPLKSFHLEVMCYDFDFTKDTNMTVG